MLPLFLTIPDRVTPGHTRDNQKSELPGLLLKSEEWDRANEFYDTLLP